jgi:hypothetical protein
MQLRGVQNKARGAGTALENARPARGHVDILTIQY